jgi:hypothetical protein
MDGGWQENALHAEQVGAHQRTVVLAGWLGAWVGGMLLLFDRIVINAKRLGLLVRQ